VLGRLACALAAVALLGLATTGAAFAKRSFYPNQVELDRALQAADEFWRDDPRNHCLGRDSGSIDDTFPARHSTAAGYSRNGECGTIHVLRRRVESYTRWQFCTLVVHEYGHTIDYVHVSDPSDIMYAKPVTAGIHPPQCDYPDPHAPAYAEAEADAAGGWAWSLEFSQSDWR
jgi:hypothetical protein